MSLLGQLLEEKPKVGFYGSAIGYVIDEGPWLRGQKFSALRPGEQPEIQPGEQGGDGLILFRSPKTALRSTDGTPVKVRVTVEILDEA